MGEIIIRDPTTGRSVTVLITGERPTAAERRQIEQNVVPKLREGTIGDVTAGSQAAPRRPPTFMERFRAAHGDLPTTAGGVRRTSGGVGEGRPVQDLTPLAAGIGATLGSVPGVLAMNPPAAAAGGMLGAGLGVQGLGFLTALGRESGLVGTEGEPFLDDPSFDFGRATVNEMAFEGLIPGLSGPVRQGARSALRYVAKIGDASRRIAARAARIGIPLGLDAVTDRRAIQQFRRVVGQMPIIGTPFTTAEEDFTRRLGQARQALVHELVPSVRMVVDERRNLSRSVVRRSRGVARLLSSRYERLLDAAEADGVRVPTVEIRSAASDLVASLRNLPQQVTEQGQQPIRELADSPMFDLARKLGELTDTMTPRQYQNATRGLRRIMGNHRDNNEILAEGMKLLDALEQDLESIPHATFQQGFRSLNKAFSEWSELLENVTGQQVSLRRFGQGVIGRRQASRVVKLVMETNDPDALADLRRLLGKTGFRDAVASRIDETFDRAVATSLAHGSETFDLGLVMRDFGLNRPRSDAFQATKRMLELADTNLRIGDLQDFFEAAKTQLDIGRVNINRFLARRTGIAGVRSGLRAMTGAGIFLGGTGTAGGSVGGPLGATLSLGGAVAAAVSLRGMSKLIANPQTVRDLTRAMDPALDFRQGKRLVARAVRVLGQDFFDIDQASDDFLRRQQALQSLNPFSEESPSAPSPLIGPSGPIQRGQGVIQ